MSTNDTDCQTKARKLGGWLGAAIFFALWLLGSVGIWMAAIAGVISALILARLICWATCGLPEPKAPMSAEEGAALRRAVPAAAPTAAVKVAEAPKPAPKAAEPVKAAPVAAPVKTPEPVAAVAEAPKPAAKPAPAPAPKGKSKPRRG
ncbi:hypothetical protein [Rhodobacter capsulatus]|uniref:Uncharacterized protein n=2 Tax=Rhodobacter capsulatus TaxID=1061 RepID=D5ATH8_RHOCB|nr:hypothetical protein [Rhodobacter capsulatus]AAC24990.1 unknown [Rhodobacter capsulatus]ADE85267.1 conserved hypothetical protein [Rhodobacter capsulatus SB 1003]ETD77210.1 hypothetical protein U717_09005 [Rhodobacter capsulatus R121]ETE54040.1 hypothetical protein U715_09010 [Rhodobacter capsulatus Y262]MDS0926977.1 hypothetical protein [Rhodobacter capsulatus]